MSNRLLSLAWKVPVSAMAKLVLVRLADRADDQGHCWPSIASLARDTGANDRTVQRALRTLRDAGHVDWMAGNSNVANKYHVHPIVPEGGWHSDTPTAEDCDNGSGTATPLGLADCHQGGGTLPPEGWHSDQPTIIEPSDEPSGEPSFSARAIAVSADHVNFTPESVSAGWNQVAGKFDLCQVRKLTEPLRSALAANMREYTADDWREALAAIAQSDFLSGRRGDFQASMEWLLKADNFAKVLVGTYDNGPDPRKDGFSRAIDPGLSRAAIRNQRRRLRSDFTEADLLPEPSPTEFRAEIPF